jgi:hypothetical protein
MNSIFLYDVGVTTPPTRLHDNITILSIQHSKAPSFDDKIVYSGVAENLDSFG